MSTTHFAGGGRLFFTPFGQKNETGNSSLRSLKKSKMHDSKIHCQQPEAQSLSCYQTYRDTPAGAAEVKAHARLAGVSISELTRRRVHGHPEPKAAAPAANLKIYGALEHTTGNFNQMTKHLNSQVLAGHAAVIEMAQMKALLVKMDAQVVALRADLIGASKT